MFHNDLTASCRTNQNIPSPTILTVDQKKTPEETQPLTFIVISFISMQQLAFSSAMHISALVRMAILTPSQMSDANPFLR